MDFKAFTSECTFLSKSERDKRRKKYIEVFINTKHEWYKEHMRLHKFSDGYCYIGYLWEFLKNPILIKESDIAEVAQRGGEVYVFWDINSCDRILIKDYWKFDKDTMLKVNFQALLEGKKYLPEDIYIFDEDFSWTLISTHEDVDGDRYCLKAEICSKDR